MEVMINSMLRKMLGGLTSIEIYTEKSVAVIARVQHNVYRKV